MEKIKTTIDISNWNEFCIGYHSIKVPPDLDIMYLGETSVDHHYINIHRDYAGSGHSLIEAQSRFGGATHIKEVNGWLFVVANEAIDRDMGLISDFSLVFWGAKKIGNDVILVSQDASWSRVGDGRAPKYHRFYETLKVEPVSKRNRNKGFCIDGYLFSGYHPKRIYNFWIHFRGSNSPQNYTSQNHSLQIWLSAEMQAPVEEEQKVTLAEEADFAKDRGFEVEDIILSHHGGKTSLRIIKEPKNGSYAHILYRSFTDAPYGLVKLPFINVRFGNDYVNESQSRAEMLTILDQIKPN